MFNAWAAQPTGFEGEAGWGSVGTGVSEVGWGWGEAAVGRAAKSQYVQAIGSGSS